MKGYVYLLCDGEYFKIGMTRKKLIKNRIAELQTGNANNIWLSSYYETDYPHKIEQMMHLRYKTNNIKNEWFKLEPNQVINFKNECKICESILNSIKDNPFI